MGVLSWERSVRRLDRGDKTSRLFCWDGSAIERRHMVFASHGDDFDTGTILAIDGRRQTFGPKNGTVI